MKVYAVKINGWNGKDYDCSVAYDKILCIKKTKDLAMNFIKNWEPWEPNEEFGHDDSKWGIIDDNYSCGGTREVHIGELEEIYAEDGNTVIGYEDLFIDGKRNYWYEWYLTLEIEEFEVEES